MKPHLTAVALVIAAVHAVGGPADLFGGVFIFGQRHIERVADAALVASARRNAVAADVAQEHAHKAAFSDSTAREKPDHA